jgi:hypothetical protein
MNGEQVELAKPAAFVADVVCIGFKSGGISRTFDSMSSPSFFTCSFSFDTVLDGMHLDVSKLSFDVKKFLSFTVFEPFNMKNEVAVEAALAVACVDIFLNFYAFDSDYLISLMKIAFNI